MPENPYQASKAVTDEAFGPVFRSKNRYASRYAIIAVFLFLLSSTLALMEFMSLDNKQLPIQELPMNIVSFIPAIVCIGFAWLTYSSLQKSSLIVDSNRIEGFLVSYGSPIDLPTKEDHVEYSMVKRFNIEHYSGSNRARWASCRWKDITEVKLSAHGLEATDRFDSQYIFAISHLSRDEYAALDETLGFYVEKKKAD